MTTDADDADPTLSARTRQGDEPRLNDHLDVPLEDEVLLEEVELISTLMIAATAADEKLEPEEIDRLLGVAGTVVPEQSNGTASI
jgi:hypothetical protein